MTYRYSHLWEINDEPIVADNIDEAIATFILHQAEIDEDETGERRTDQEYRWTIRRVNMVKSVTVVVR